SVAYNTFDCNINTDDLPQPTIIQNITTNNFAAEGATLINSTPQAPIFDPSLQNATPTPINMPAVNNGTGAIKLNRSTGGGDLTTMSINFVATSTTVSFNFSYVVQEAHQEPTQVQFQSFFAARILNAQNQNVSTNELC